DKREEKKSEAPVFSFSPLPLFAFYPLLVFEQIALHRHTRPIERGQRKTIERLGGGLFQVGEDTNRHRLTQFTLLDIARSFLHYGGRRVL
ncbi:MAG: hypothetical protein ACRD2L_18855, partial [Terriglobia bacterium]